MRNKFFISGIWLVAVFLYIVGPYVLFKVCEVGDKPMKCHYSVMAETGLALLLLGIALLYTLTITARERSLLSAAVALLGIVAILIPRVLIGGCSMKTMACQSITFPAFYVISILLIVISEANIIFQLKRNGNT